MIGEDLRNRWEACPVCEDSIFREERAPIPVFGMCLCHEEAEHTYWHGRDECPEAEEPHYHCGACHGLRVEGDH